MNSKEVKLFRYLKQLMDFEEIDITKVIAISAPVLAQAMSTYRTVLVQRHKSSPGLFRNEKWKQEKSDLRFKTMEHFQRQVISFEWNSTLNIDDAPVLAVAHGTGYEKAKKNYCEWICKIEPIG